MSFEISRADFYRFWQVESVYIPGGEGDVLCFEVSPVARRHRVKQALWRRVSGLVS